MSDDSICIRRLMQGGMTYDAAHGKEVRSRYLRKFQRSQMNNLYQFMPTWHRPYDQASLEYDLEIKYQGPGWYVKENSTALILQLDKDTNFLLVYVWPQGVDPRPMFRDLLEQLPVIPVDKDAFGCSRS